MLPKPVFVRVKNKTSKHEYTIAEHSVTDAVELLDKPAVDAVGQPLPPKPFVPHKGAGKKSSAPSASKTTPEEPAESQEG
jgi:hypothetical protein